MRISFRHRLCSAVVVACAVSIACTPLTAGDAFTENAIYDVALVQAQRIVARASGSVSVVGADGRTVSRRAFSNRRILYDGNAGNRLKEYRRQFTAAAAAAQALGGIRRPNDVQLRELTDTTFASLMAGFVTHLEDLAGSPATGMASMRIRGTSGETLVLSRFGAPGGPDTLLTLESAGERIFTRRTSWSRVREGWIAERIEATTPLGGGLYEIVEGRIAGVDSDGAAATDAEIDALVTERPVAVHGALAKFCTQDDFDAGLCDFSQDWGDGADSGPFRCALARAAAAVANFAYVMATDGYYAALHAVNQFCDAPALGSLYDAGICAGALATAGTAYFSMGRAATIADAADMYAASVCGPF
jgi:hypothetical protein